MFQTQVQNLVHAFGYILAGVGVGIFLTGFGAGLFLKNLFMFKVAGMGGFAVLAGLLVAFAVEYRAERTGGSD